MERFYTGGEEYALVFRKGQHELRLILDDETGDCETVTAGHYQSCRDHMSGIVRSNVDYDYNL